MSCDLQSLDVDSIYYVHNSQLDMVSQYSNDPRQGSLLPTYLVTQKAIRDCKLCIRSIHICLKKYKIMPFHIFTLPFIY